MIDLLKTYSLDLEIQRTDINWKRQKRYWLWRHTWKQCIEIAKELNLEYVFTKRQQIPWYYDKINWREMPMIDVCIMKKNKDNLFTKIEEWTETQKITD